MAVRASACSLSEGQAFRRKLLGTAGLMSPTCVLPREGYHGDRRQQKALLNGKKKKEGGRGRKKRKTNGRKKKENTNPSNSLPEACNFIGHTELEVPLGKTCHQNQCISLVILLVWLRVERQEQAHSLYCGKFQTTDPELFEHKTFF